jgi:TATA-box binding protein (TBP) (component of TFIID and TFIIIB)
MESPILTTMVVLYTMGVRLDTNVLVQNLPLTDKIIKIEKQGILKRGESKKDRIRHRNVPTPQPKRTTGFGHNSITLVLLSNGDGSLLEKEITVKIFQNGVFHITGVLDEKYDRDAVARLQKHITEHCSESVISGTWTPENRRVVLMNYKTSLLGVNELSREQLYQSVKKQGIKTVYEPDVYPGVKIYFANTRWIAKVFRTGNIILTGVTTSAECAELADKLKPVLLQKA